MTEMRFVIWPLLLVLFSVYLPIESQGTVRTSVADSPMEEKKVPCATFKFDERNSGRSPFELGENPGHLIWSLKTPRPDRCTMDRNETLLMSTASKLLLIDSSGREMMNISAPPDIFFHSMPVRDQYGNIYVGSYHYSTSTGSMFSFTPEGKIRWMINGTMVMGYSPKIRGDKLYFFSREAALYCAGLNGTVLWKYDFYDSDDFSASPAFDSKGNVYFHNDKSSQWGELCSLDQNGKLRWAFNISEPIVSCPSIADDDTVYFSNRKTLYSFYPNGSLRWSRDFKISDIADGVVCLKDGSVLVTCKNTIHLLDSKGNLTASKTLGTQIKSGAIVSSDGFIIYVTAFYELKVLKPDLKDHWTTTLTSSSIINPIIGKMGDIYVVTEDYYYHRIGYYYPTKPLNVTADFGNGIVSIRWRPPLRDGGFPMDKYHILRGMDGSVESFLQEVPGSCLEFNDSIQNGHNYSYRIVAINPFGFSGPSEAISGIPSGLNNPPTLESITNEGNTVRIEWIRAYNDGGAPLLNYSLLKSLDNSTFSAVSLIPVNERVYVDKDVEPGVMYFYRLVTLNKNGAGPESATLWITHLRKPTPPLDLTGVRGDGFNDLSWNVPSSCGGMPLKGYVLYRFYQTAKTEFRIEPGNLSYKDAGLMNGEVYSYSMVAENGIGISDPTEKIMLIPSGVPKSPTLTSRFNDGEVSLEWNIPYDGGSPITGFELFRQEDGASFEPLASLGADQRGYSDLAFGPVFYRYYIVALNDLGHSEPSNNVSVTGFKFNLTPILDSAILNKDRIDIDWSLPKIRYPANFSLIGFVVVRTDLSDGKNVQHETVEDHYSDLSFVFGVSYEYCIEVGYSVRGFIMHGCQSNNQTVTPLTTPDPPVLVSSEASDRKNSFDWDHPEFTGGSPILRYVIEKSVQGSSIIFPVEGKTSFTDYNLKNGLSYSYSIYSVNSVGQSYESLYLELMPLGLPSRPEIVNVTVIDLNAVLIWGAPKDDGGLRILGYRIYRGSDPSSMEIVSVCNGSPYSEPMEAGEERYYKIAAYTDVGEGEASELVRAFRPIDKVQGDEKNEVDNHIYVYATIGFVSFVIIGAILILLVRKKGNNTEE